MEDKIDLRWRTSSYSGNGGGNCVEVAAGGRVLVRDSQDRAGTVLRFPPSAWRRFADRVKRSLALDLPWGIPPLNLSARFPGYRCGGHFYPLRLPWSFLRCERPSCLGRQEWGLGKPRTGRGLGAVRASPVRFRIWVSSSWRRC
jgi:hypothetical protein